MKKSKLLTPILGLSSVAFVAIPLSSCSCNQSGNLTITGIAITNQPTKTSYVVGQKFDKTGLVVTATYSDNVTTKDVTSECTFTPGLDIALTKDITKVIVTHTASQKIAEINITVSDADPQDLANIKKINEILSGYEGIDTMKDVLSLLYDQGIDVENIVPEKAEYEYFWDQEKNRFFVADILTKNVVYKTDDHTITDKNWKIWRMVDESTFDSYSQYSQYLKNKSSSNGLTKVDYSFVSGFDCGENEDVRNVHYFYEKAEHIQPKDITINTCSNSTNVDISAYDGEGVAGQGDTISHYGDMGELTVVSNDTYNEEGNVLICQVYDGTIDIAQTANIEITYVKATGVVLDNFKQEGEQIDKIYAADTEIQTEIENQSEKYQGKVEEKSESAFDNIKKEKYEEKEITPSYAFTVTKDGETTYYYDTLTQISTDSNKAEAEAKDFDGWTISLNKDYDMVKESADWLPISSYTESTNAYAASFKGIFNGNSHSIINFNTNGSGKSLFGNCYGKVQDLNFTNCDHLNENGGDDALLISVLDGEINNVHAYNCHITAKGSTGFLVSWAICVSSDKTTSIINCSNDADCSIYNLGNNQTGGIVGQVTSIIGKVVFDNVINNANVSGMNSVGGIVGQFGNSVVEGEFKNCKNTGIITIMGYVSTTTVKPIYAGGLVGYLNSGGGKANKLTFTNCINGGTVTTSYAGDDGQGPWCGGFTGYSNGFTLTFKDCTNNGNVGLIEGEEGEKKCYYAAGFSAYNNGNTLEKFENCENTGKIHASTKVGHLSAVKQDDDKQYATDCTIEHGTLVDINLRTTIYGEPE